MAVVGSMRGWKLLLLPLTGSVQMNPRSLLSGTAST